MERSLLPAMNQNLAVKQDPLNGKLPAGGEFLLDDTAATSIFVPEDFSSEQRQIAATTEDFVRKEILPNLERIEAQDFDLVVAKMRQCADLGLFLPEIPEAYGGLELDKATNMLLIEKMAAAGSFSITYGGQTGIGLLPLVYYGTPGQKERYLDKLASGEWLAAYALTEPDCGSDPLSSRTTATLSDDGRYYVLNGSKQFITNSAFASLFTVFAKIDGQHFSAFLVERGFPGLSVGREEEKMGLKGSSTTSLSFQEVRVPVENLLGEAGKGHKIAFNVLNVGRLKVAATCTGMAKEALAAAAAYAAQRKQFGRPIGDFGAIREKLADLVATTFAAEAVVYRIAGLLDRRLATIAAGADYYQRYQKGIEEYATECAIAKVFCSECLDQVVDQALQIHGGYGYIRDYAVERYYRDARIQRIFEGTNEINRILIPTLLARRAEQGLLNFRSAGEAASAPASPVTGTAEFAAELALLDGQKTLFRQLMNETGAETVSQEVQLALADLAIEIFALESTVLRAAQVVPVASERKRSWLQAVVAAATFEGGARFRRAARRCGAYALRGERLQALEGMITKGCSYPAEGLLDAKRHLAEAALEAGRFPF